MGNTIDNGGPAFPQVPTDGAHRGTDGLFPAWNGHGMGGMTLRQWYAGRALPFYLQDGQSFEDASKHSFMAADAMIAEEKKPPIDNPFETALEDLYRWARSEVAPAPAMFRRKILEAIEIAKRRKADR